MRPFFGKSRLAQLHIMYYSVTLNYAIRPEQPQTSSKSPARVNRVSPFISALSELTGKCRRQNLTPVNSEELSVLDEKTNKLLNKSILFFLKRLKTMLGFYAQYKQLDTRLPLDAIKREKNKSIRESNLCKILGTPTNWKTH